MANESLAGRLYYTVVSERYDPESKSKRYTIKCECGNIVEKSRYHIRGKIKTCGMKCPISSSLRSLALKGKPNISAMLPSGEAGLRALYGNYKRRARVAGRCFDLTKEQFKQITKSDCYYCGGEPSMVYQHKIQDATEEARANSAYVYNSVDRIDSDYGYSRPSCKMCNMMKTNHTEEEFLLHIRKIHLHTSSL